MKRQKISSLPCALACLLLFIIVGSAKGPVEQESCSPSSSGTIQNIMYSFRLKGDPASCGDPNYELICNDNKTILEAFSAYVTEIFYEYNMLRVVDVGLATGTCGLPSRSTSEIFSDRYCYVSIGNNKFVYVTSGSRVEVVHPFCHFQSIVPASYFNLIGSENDIFQHLQKGFYLAWFNENITRSEIITECLKAASRNVKYDLHGKNIPNWILYPISLEIRVLKCLYGCKQTYRNSISAYNLTLVFIVFLDIAILLFVIAILGRLILAPLSIYVFVDYKFSMMRKPIDAIEKFLRYHHAPSPTRYSYIKIIRMTNHFKEKLGEGGFGSVFKGELPGGHLVAIKILGNSTFNGEDFINEVSTIGRIHHVNVVRLGGFFSEGSKRALVYEFIPKGSLDRYIFHSNGTNKYFTLEKRTEIALGVPRGIDYLHRGCDMRILHFNIKPHNILLDQCFNPKVSDFGLAKSYPKDYSLVSISVARGTIGYIAPELVSRSFGAISYKSDVYSFGMLLLEMAGGRRNVDARAKNSSRIYYPPWIYDRLKQREGLELSNAIEIDDVERKLSKVGLWSIRMRPMDHLSMSKVVEMLEAVEERHSNYTKLKP